MKPLETTALPERLTLALKHKTSQISERTYTNVRFARELTEELTRRLRATPADQRERVRRTTYGNTSVTAWTNGANEPPLAVLEVAADLLGVRLSWLVAGEGEMAAADDAPVGQPQEPVAPPRKAGTPVALPARGRRRA